MERSNGGGDEFIELYNPTTSDSIENWTICAHLVAWANLGILHSVPLPSSPLAGTSSLEDEFPWLLGCSADIACRHAGIALVPTQSSTPAMSLTVPVRNAVGLPRTTTFQEGTNLVPLLANGASSYERNTAYVRQLRRQQRQLCDFTLMTTSVPRMIRPRHALQHPPPQPPPRTHPLIPPPTHPPTPAPPPPRQLEPRFAAPSH